MIEVADNGPAVPPSKPMQVSSHLKDRNVATKVRALAVKAGERNAAMAPNQMKEERAPTADAQTKMLIDLVKSLLNIERRRREEEEEEEEQLRRQLAAEESGFVDFADLDYDMIHSASDSVSDNESLPDIIDPNLSN